MSALLIIALRNNRGKRKMAEKVDRRVRKTKAQLRAGLARLMQKKSIKEITVKELVEEVDINRSTFYLHYTDIYQMLESIEAELMDEVSHLVEDYPLDPLNNKESSYPFIEQIFTILDNNKDICIALLGKKWGYGVCQPNRKADCGYSSASSVYSFA